MKSRLGFMSLRSIGDVSIFGGALHGREYDENHSSYLHRSKALDPFVKREQLVFGSLVQSFSSVHFGPEALGRGPCVEVLVYL